MSYYLAPFYFFKPTWNFVELLTTNYCFPASSRKIDFKKQKQI